MSELIVIAYPEEDRAEKVMSAMLSLQKDEFVSLAERNKHFPEHEKANPEMDAWTDRLVRQLLHAPGSPCVAQRIFSAVK